MKGFRVFFIFSFLAIYCFGAGIMDGFVIYHGWRFVGKAEFIQMHKETGARIVGLFVLPMLVCTIFTVLLFWFRPALLPKKLVWMAIACQAVGWLSSAFIQIPIQGQLDEGKNMELLNKLIVTDWIRVAASLAFISVVISMVLQVCRSYYKPNRITI
jgi:hypothetical protein